MTMRALGVDLGSKRIGLAVSDSAGTIATPIGVIARTGDPAAHRRSIAAEVAEWEAEIVVVGLPTSLDGSTGPAAEAGWWEKLKSAFGSLVTVRRSTEEENRRISLQDKDYVRQRLWLQVEVAYLALMRHEQETFDTALQRVGASVAEWFDPDSAEVAAVATSLDTLSDVDLSVSWPDISEPWNTLRLVREARHSTPPAVPGPSAETAEAPEPATADESGGGQP